MQAVGEGCDGLAAAGDGGGEDCEAGQSWKWQSWAGMGIMKGGDEKDRSYESASPTLPLQSRWMVSFC